MKESRGIRHNSFFPAILIAFVVFLFLSFTIPLQLNEVVSENLSKPPDSNIIVSILTTGDAMSHLPQTTAAWDADSGAYLYYDVLNWLSPVVKKYDLSIINFETTLAGKPYKGYPQFCAPDNYARDLNLAGFNFFAQANNHAVDRHTKGINMTIDKLNNFGIQHTGTFKDKAERDSTYPVIINIRDVKIALLNCTFSTNGIKPKTPALVNMVNKEQIKEDLVKAREQSPDLIMMVVHWGAEYKRLPNTYQKNIANFFIEQGVDVIIGHHPHVLQPVEWKKTTYEGKEKDVLVIWSLGNFFSNQRARYKNGGMFVNFDIIKNRFTKETHVGNVTYYPFWVWKSHSPKKYMLLPCELIDSLTKTNNLSSSDIAMYKTFTNDTRSHLLKNGVVKELLYHSDR